MLGGFAHSDDFQVRYATNLNIGDSFVDFTNSGATVANGVSQNLCLNLYTFDPQEELISCCTCTVTPNALVSLSVLHSLIANPLTPAIPTSVVIKVVASTGLCNAATVAGLAHGALAWGTTLHQNTSTTTPTYALTETAFSFADLTAAELTISPQPAVSSGRRQRLRHLRRMPLEWLGSCGRKIDRRLMPASWKMVSGRERYSVRP